MYTDQYFIICNFSRSSASEKFGKEKKRTFLLQLPFTPTPPSPFGYPPFLSTLITDLLCDQFKMADTDNT